MSKVTVALGSFIVGAALTFFILSGNQTSTRAQTAISFGSAGIPVVPPLTGVKAGGNTVTNLEFNLDGVMSEGDVFNNATLVYGGGAFKLIRPTFNGTISLKLIGAAANTLALIQFIQAAEAGRKPAPAVPGEPIKRAALTTKINHIDSLTSPFGQR